MLAVGSVLEAADRKASFVRRPVPANSVKKPEWGFWAALRCLKAELRAFPVRTKRIDGNLIVMAELPGLKKDEVKVDLTDSLLVIEAEPNRGNEVFFRRAGRRVIPLPDGAGIELAKAQLKNGVLTVSLPVSKSREGRRVSVEEVVDIEFPLPDYAEVARKSASPVPR